TLGNRYLVERELGQGGIGAVYLARDQRVLSRRVVIKVLLDKSQGNPYLQRKFREEMAALALIDHPGVIGVFDLGTTPDGKAFLVIQYVDGVNLRQLIRFPDMEFARAANILRQMGEALNSAHEKGIFHRDLKPENIMVQKLSGKEYVKLIDFGVASIQNSPFAQSQGKTSIAGTR